MQGAQKQMIEAYDRVRIFLESHPAPAPATYAEQQRVLEEVLAELIEHSSAQVRGKETSQAEKKRLDALMRQLRDRHMRPIVRIARFAIQADPGIKKQLQMPPGPLGVVKLLAKAKAMREAAVPFRETLENNGLQAGFLDRFVEAENAIRRSTVGRAKSVGTHVGASASMAERLRRGREAVDALDAIILVAFEGDAGVLAEWRVARRVKALPGGGRAAESIAPVMTPGIKPAAA